MFAILGITVTLKQPLLSKLVLLVSNVCPLESPKNLIIFTILTHAQEVLIVTTQLSLTQNVLTANTNLNSELNQQVIVLTYLPVSTTT